MGPADGDDDAGPEGEDAAGVPPDPLDRPWVHPSELASYVATPSPPTPEVRPREWAIGLGAALAGALATVLVLVAFGALGGGHRAPTPPVVVTTPSDVVDYALAERIAPVVTPSIVLVRAADGSTRPLGSGVAIQSHRVITNAHVVSGTTTFDVVTESGDTHAAKLLGTDPQTDLALLDVSAALQPAQLGSAAPRLGEPVIALASTRTGAHYQLDLGVVTDENLMLDTGAGVPVAGLVELGMGTGADWSGGALVSGDGTVVGIVTAPATPRSRGVAVPAGLVRDVADQLDSSGKAVHGYLGVLAADDTSRGGGGARVTVVVPGSPAAHAGLAVGDVVTQAGGETISDRADLVAAVRALRPQDPLTLSYLRGDDHERHTQVNVVAADPRVQALWPGIG